MAQRFRDRRSGKTTIFSSALWIKGGSLKEVRWLSNGNGLTCWRRDVIWGWECCQCWTLSDRLHVSAGEDTGCFVCVWGGGAVVSGIRVAGGCAILEGSQAYRISEQRLQCKWNTAYIFSLWYLMFWDLQFFAHTGISHPAKEDIMANLTLFWPCH